MKIETLIESLERTIKGKQALAKSLTDPIIFSFVDMNIEELTRILADVRKVELTEDTPVRNLVAVVLEQRERAAAGLPTQWGEIDAGLLNFKGSKDE